MKIILLGIAFIFFGISIILVSGGLGRMIGIGVSFVGLIMSIAGCFTNNSK